LFAGKWLIGPRLRCWRGIEALMMRERCASSINAGHDRTDLAIGNSRGRYVGDGVDDGTHRILHRHQKALKKERSAEMKTLSQQRTATRQR
jgi:hypothetical protein